MARPLLAPGLHELVNGFGDTYSAVGIANIEDVAGDRLADCVDQLECRAGGELTEVEQCDQSVWNAKINA